MMVFTGSIVISMTFFLQSTGECMLFTISLEKLDLGFVSSFVFRISKLGIIGEELRTILPNPLGLGLYRVGLERLG